MSDGTSVVARLGRRLRLGVIGGGAGSFIGNIHRSAAVMDNAYEVVAGILSSDPGRSHDFAAHIGIAPERAYDTPAAMARSEAERADGIDAVAIMTPNDSHCALSRVFLEAGCHVVCDKPLSNSLDEALDLVRRVRAGGRLFCLTYNYSGYPMVRQARAMVHAGLLGDIRLVKGEYVQAALAPRPDHDPATDRRWRLDPAKGGPSLVTGDIGTHVHHLLRYVTGREIAALAADAGSIVAGRSLHDTAQVLLRLDNGGKGLVWISNAAAGGRHGLMFRIHGEKGALEWRQEEPDELIFTPLDQPEQRFVRGGAGLLPLARRGTRVAVGHPEGYIEAFANLYAEFAEAIVADMAGASFDPELLTFPTVEDGALGVQFVHAVIDSAGRDSAWVALDPLDALVGSPLPRA